MSSILRIYGDFLPQDLDLRGKLTPYQSWNKGEKNRKGDPYDESGVAIDVSSRGMDDYKGQFCDATKFLIENRESLRQLMDRRDVAEGILDFGLERPEHPAFFRRLPRSLVGHAAICKLAIELSFYWSCKDPEKTIPNKDAEQDGARQPATRPEPKSE